MWQESKKNFLNANSVEIETENEEPQKPSYFGAKDEEAWTLDDRKMLQGEDKLCKHITTQPEAKEEIISEFYRKGEDSVTYTQKVSAQKQKIIVVPTAHRAIYTESLSHAPSKRPPRTRGFKTTHIIKDRDYTGQRWTQISQTGLKHALYAKSAKRRDLWQAACQRS